jgi:hypothetical protein
MVFFSSTAYTPLPAGAISPLSTRASAHIGPNLFSSIEQLTYSHSLESTCNHLLIQGECWDMNDSGYTLVSVTRVLCTKCQGIDSVLTHGRKMRGDEQLCVPYRD